MKKLFVEIPIAVPIILIFVLVFFFIFNAYSLGYIQQTAPWTNTVYVGVDSASNVWKDNQTRLYWSGNQGQFTNSFTTAYIPLQKTLHRVWLR
jgi:hypothetical protein